MPAGNNQSYERKRNFFSIEFRRPKMTFEMMHGKKGKLGPHDCGGVIMTVGPSKNMAKPAGEWNRMIVTCKGTHMQVELNGEKIIDLQLDKSAVRNRPLKGYLGLQDHGQPLWFRNIKIKELED